MFIIKLTATTPGGGKDIRFIGNEGISAHKFEAKRFTFKDQAEKFAADMPTEGDGTRLTYRVIKAPSPSQALHSFLDIARHAQA
jgi:hypothetical protein